jgi:hypothetical protein
MSIEDFARAHTENLYAGMDSPYFKGLMSALDAVYRSAIRAMPPDGVPTVYGKFLLICDKAFRSAAVLVAASHPDDSVAITRRAVEAAKTALAIKLNDNNVANWLSSTERLERWAARQSNERPKFFKIELENVKGDALIDELDKILGVLSDAYVHFTPEFYSSLAWETRADSSGQGGKIVLNYFHTSFREVERHYLMLGAAHILILRAFDRCVDDRLVADQTHRASRQAFHEIGKQLSVEYRRKYAEEPMPEGNGF